MGLGGAGTGDRVPEFAWRAVLRGAGRLWAVGGTPTVRAVALAMVVGAGVGGCYGVKEEARSTVMPAEMCSSSWWSGDIESDSGAGAPAPVMDVNTPCDAEGNTPVHLALRREGIFTEREFNATASVIRAGADLFAVCRRDGTTPRSAGELSSSSVSHAGIWWTRCDSFSSSRRTRPASVVIVFGPSGWRC